MPALIGHPCHPECASCHPERQRRIFHLAPKGPKRTNRNWSLSCIFECHYFQFESYSKLIKIMKRVYSLLSAVLAFVACQNVGLETDSSEVVEGNSGQEFKEVIITASRSPRLPTIRMRPRTIGLPGTRSRCSARVILPSLPP